VRRIVSALLLLCIASFAHADEETWYSVHLDGRKIGHMRSLRAEQSDGRVRHEQRLELSLERSGMVLRIVTDERTWERADGTPLAFETDIDTAGSATRLRGEIGADGTLRVSTTVQERTTQQELRWPPGALLPEGQQLAAERAGFAPGTRYELLAFDPGSLQALRIETRVRALEDVDIHGRQERLLPLAQSLELGGIRTETVSWVSRKTHRLRRLRMPAIGLQLEMLACDRACALAPVQPTDVLASTTVKAPAPLGQRERSRPLRYRLKLARGSRETLDAPPGQSVQALPGEREFALVVDPRGDATAPPQAEDLVANRWLQSDAPEVVALAREAVQHLHGEAMQVEALERFVRNYISTKSLRIGYASASEVVAGREGDCTEHAVLLAAMIRALDIPARVATGIAYAPGFAGQRDVFVPHAWVNAWVDGRWRGYDAALPSFDAAHIAFAVGDGDPFRFYGGIELLGGVEILEVSPARRRDRAGQDP
jgi:hypothetical protein